MLLADWFPLVGSAMRNLAILVVALSVLNSVMIFCELISKFFLYRWIYYRDLEERSRRGREEKLLTASERILELAGDRIKKITEIAAERKASSGNEETKF